MGLVAQLCMNSTNRGRAVAWGAIGAVLRIMTRYRSDADVQALSCAAIGNFVGGESEVQHSTVHLAHTRVVLTACNGPRHQVQAINVRHATQYKVAVQLVRAMRAHPSDTRVACQGALALASLVRPSLESMGVISADPRLLAAAKRGAASTGLDLSGAGLLDASHRQGVEDAGGIPALTWSMAACDQFPDVVTMLCIAMRQLASTSAGMARHGLTVKRLTLL